MGFQLALDQVSFAEAEGVVIDHAYKRGAAHLTNNQQTALLDWIARSVLKAVDEFTPEIREYRAMASRVHEDIARCEARWKMM